MTTCSYRFCCTAYVLYSSHSHCVLTVFWLFLLYTRSFVHIGETRASCEWTRRQCEWSWNVPETVAKYIFVFIFVLIRLCLTTGVLISTYPYYFLTQFSSFLFVRVKYYVELSSGRPIFVLFNHAQLIFFIYFMHLTLRQRRMGTNFKVFTFILIRE